MKTILFLLVISPGFCVALYQTASDAANRMRNRHFRRKGER